MCRYIQSKTKPEEKEATIDLSARKVVSFYTNSNPL